VDVNLDMFRPSMMNCLLDVDVELMEEMLQSVTLGRGVGDTTVLGFDA
jgi:hypothetical protein